MDSRVGTRFGRYKITGLLGRGGMGEVYEAFDTEKQRTVALKILADQLSSDERFRTRFERESHAAASLQEPHIVAIHDWGEIDGNLFIEMPRIRGQTLQQLLADGPLEPKRAVAVVNQVAAALDAAHAEGLVHRDVKPANIIVTPADFAYLLDFGIAEAKGESHLTMTGTAIGSFAYMAPERFDDRPTTPAVDIYALGCVLYEALTGAVPFPAQSMEQAIAAALSAPPPRPSVTNPRVPASFDRVIARALAKDPADRYSAADAFGQAAQQALREDWTTALGPQVALPALTYAAPSPPHWQPGPPPISMPPPMPGTQGSRWVMPVVIAVAVALALGAVGVVIGLVANGHTRSDESSSNTTPYGQSDSGISDSSSTPPSSPSRARALPPMVLGPDGSQSHEVCDDGYSMPNQTGFGAHSGRGSDKTSCRFASSVLAAYWAQYGRPSPTPRTISAAGAVDCADVEGAACDPADSSRFLMQCAPDPSGDWITCTGGSDARVYLY